MRTKFKAWAEPFINEHPEVMCSFEQLNELGSYYLEIGSGKGQFLLDMALKNPNLTFIGVERNITCAGFTAKKLVENEIKNAKLVHGDAGQMTPSIKDASVEGIFFPASIFKHSLISVNSNGSTIDTNFKLI